MKITFKTLGCKLNFAESSAIANTFRAAGHEVAENADLVDAFVINTCAVTDVAEKKCRAAIRQAKKKNPDAVIAVIGCYSQLSHENLAGMEEVDIIVGNERKFDLVAIMESYKKGEGKSVNNSNILKTGNFFPGFSLNDRTRTFLKVQDGCNHKCAYCIVPLARGHSRSATISEVTNQISDIENQGVKEIVLTGVNIGDFGKPNRESLLMLLEKIASLEIKCRIRIGSIEPELLSDDIIQLVASSPRLMPHFHLPLQSGSDKILKAMKRRYDTALFADRISRIHALLPYAFIACDVIAGFPGETEADFEDGYHFIESLTFSFLHVFPYSERPGTVAAMMLPRVDARTKKVRSNFLQKLSESGKRNFYQRFEGDEREVLFESNRHQDTIHGFTDNYIRVVHQWHKSLANCCLPVRLVKTDNHGMMIGRCERFAT